MHITSRESTIDEATMATALLDSTITIRKMFDATIVPIEFSAHAKLHEGDDDQTDYDTEHEGSEPESRDEFDQFDDSEHDTDRSVTSYASTLIFNTCPQTTNREIRTKAYSLLLASPKSVNINRFTSSFEEEGLYGVSIGIFQAVASTAMQFVNELGKHPGLRNARDEKAENQIVLQFTDTVVDLVLRVFGVVQPKSFYRVTIKRAE